MRSVGQFIHDRHDAKPTIPADVHQPGHEDARGELQRERIMPWVEREAERAGVDQRELRDALIEVFAPLPLLLFERIAQLPPDDPGDGEILGALSDVAFDSFMAGVQWEQQRHLPDLDTPTTEGDR